MVVISDTSVISNLLRINHLFLLPIIFGQATIPPAVEQELGRMSEPVPFSLSDHPWLQVQPLNDYQIASQLRLQLDPGESEAIALAEEFHADLLLIDEAKGRKIAQERGIPMTGLLGVLLIAKEQKHIQEVVPLMDRLIREANFRIGQALYEVIREEAGE